MQGSHVNSAAQLDRDATPAGSDSSVKEMGSVGMADGLLFHWMFLKPPHKGCCSTTGLQCKPGLAAGDALRSLSLVRLCDQYCSMLRGPSLTPSAKAALSALYCTNICCCLQVQARLLPYPTLTYADTSRRTDKSGQWDPAKFYRPGNMDSYAFASFTNPATAENLKVRSDWGNILEQGASWRPASPTCVGRRIIGVAPATGPCLRKVPWAPTGAQQHSPLPKAVALPTPLTACLCVARNQQM